MNPQETHQVAACDKNWVPFSERVKISSTNIRLETTVPQKEETFQVGIDLIKNSTCFKIDLRKEKKSRCENMPYHQFIKIIINHFLKQHKSLSNLNYKHYHTIKDDVIVSRLKFVRIGTQGKKTADTHVAHVDVFEESGPEPAKKKTAEEEKSGKVTFDPPKKLKGVTYLTLEEQEVVDIMKALKERRQPSKRQPSTRGSSEGTGTIPGVLDKSTVISATLSEGTEESEYSEEDQLDEEKDEKDESEKGGEEVSDAANANVIKNSEIKDDAKKAELPLISSSVSLSLAPTTTLPLPSVSTTPPIPQQTTTPIPTPSITTDALTVTTVVLKSDALSAVQLRVAKLEKYVFELMKVDLSTKALATLKIQVPTVVEDYPRSRTPTADQEQESEKSPSDILKIKKEQAEKQHMPKFTIKSTNKGVADTVQNRKRKHDGDDDDDDEDPSARPNQGKKIKRRRTKESESSKKASSTKETPNGKTLMKGSKTGKFASVKELVKEPINEVLMDDVCDDVIRDDEQPHDASEPKIAKTLNLEWALALVVLSISYRTVVVDYFFNNDLEYLKTSDPEVTYTTSVIKTKAAPYEIKGIKDMVPTFWSTIKHAYEKDVEKGIKHWGERRKLWLPILDMFLIAVQHKLFHLDESDIFDFIIALRMFTRSLIFKRCVEDLQLGVESYEQKLNITKPQKTFPEIKFKEPYTTSYDPPGIIYEDLNKQKGVLRADELYKFSNGILKSVHDEIHHRVLDFRLEYNTEIPTRKWTAIDQKRSGTRDGLQTDDSYHMIVRKNTENLNTKSNKLNEELSDCETDLYHYKRGLSQVKKEKEGLDNKLTGFESALKDLDNLLGSQRSDKNKEGLRYNAVPPLPTQVYSPPKKDLSWIGLPEFVDDTVTDYSRPTPSIDVSKCKTSDLQSGNFSVSEHEESSGSIMSKPMIKYVKAADCSRVIKTNNTENARKSTVKYAEMYMNISRSPKVREHNTDFHQIVDFLEASHIRRHLKLNDEEGISSLPDAELFKNLSLMGYNILPNQMFTFQKGQFSHQWKFLIHTIMQCLSLKSTGFNEFSSNIATDVPAKATISDGGQNQRSRPRDIWIKGEIIDIGEELGADKSTELGVIELKKWLIGGFPTVCAIFTTASMVTPYTRRPRGIRIGSSLPMRSPIIRAKDKGKEKVVESEVPKKRKLQEQIDAQIIHFRGMKLEQIKGKFIPVWKQLEDFMPTSSKEEGERVKRQGLKIDQGSSKRMKTSEDVSEEDLKGMMQLVPLEEVYIEALQTLHCWMKIRFSHSQRRVFVIFRMYPVITPLI
uniref:Uncharacterized protein n=1 Tax=Tanacetum cinerariifolium TaxID=118510 RepID=A0A6L2M5K6_TANCI|nr:hypothetical protein [Tanacetum cinerariifolium]